MSFVMHLHVCRYFIIHMLKWDPKKIILAFKDTYSYFIESQIIIIYNCIQMLLKPHYSAIIWVFANAILYLPFLFNILMDVPHIIISNVYLI